MNSGAVPAPSSSGGRTLLWALSLLSTLPLWLCTYPPLTDYPQHLAMASILRHYSDPAFHLIGTYRLALWHPNSLFEIAVAIFAFVFPIGVAGKIVLGTALAAVGPAAAALAKRAGAPAASAVLALAFAWNVSVWYGFVGTVLAAPLLLAGVAWADGALERNSRRDALILAALGLAFYITHLQFLFVFAGCVGWLGIARRLPPQRIALSLAPLLPALICGVLFVLTKAPASPWDLALSAAPAGFVPPPIRLLVLPVLLFGGPAGKPVESIPMALAAIAFVASFAFREKSAERRFLTLALWLIALFLFMPTNLVGQNIFQRMAPIAAMFATAALPLPKPSRATALQLVAIAALLAEITLSSRVMITAADEEDGLATLLARPGLGTRFVGLMPDAKTTALRYPDAPLIHFGAYYQAEYGGTLLASFAEIGHSIVQVRDEKRGDAVIDHPGDSVPIDWNQERDGARFDYVLVHGDTPEFGSSSISAGRWHLVRP